MLARTFHCLPNSGDYLLRPGFNLCVRLCHGKYSNVHEKLLFYNLHVALCYTLTLGQWQIQGGAACAHHPKRDPILSFLHMFPPKSARIEGRRPPPPAQQEILDLQPLVTQH